VFGTALDTASFAARHLGWSASTMTCSAWKRLFRFRAQDSNPKVFGPMKMTIDIPEDQLREAMRHCKAATNREAVLIALEEYNRPNRMAALVKLSGTCRNLDTNEEIEALQIRKTFGTPAHHVKSGTRRKRC
jgi:hypothetical protein